MATFRDPTGLARTATIFLCIYMLVRAITAVRLLIVLPGAPPIPILAFAYFASLILCYIVVACWIYRANANAHLFDGAAMTITPGWSVGWFFIPFANLAMPYRGVRETWVASHKGAGLYKEVESPAVGWWWGLWIVNNIASNIAAFSGADTSYASPEMHFFNLIAAAIGLASALVLISMMNRIGKAQILASRGNVFA